MVFEGHVENGAVVFERPLPLPDGTRVRVESLAVFGFWQSPSIDELTRQQGVPALSTFEELLGGWPADEMDDDFEASLHRWREQEMDRRL